MANIRPFFKGVTKDCQDRFKSAKCLLTISVGQASHEGELFSATMDLVNESFGACVLLVDDSLQRHTMALEGSNEADFFYEVALKEGVLWLERNKKYYEKLTIPTTIMHWDRWLKHPNFSAQQDKVKKLIQSDPTYKAAFDESINNFLKKYCERLAKQDNFDIERARRLSLDFVVEECTALGLWPELGCHFEAYPNKHNRAIEDTRHRFVLAYYPDLLQAVTIGFKNAKQMKPQSFELL